MKKILIIAAFIVASLFSSMVALGQGSMPIISYLNGHQEAFDAPPGKQLIWKASDTEGRFPFTFYVDDYFPGNPNRAVPVWECSGRCDDFVIMFNTTESLGVIEAGQVLTVTVIDDNKDIRDIFLMGPGGMYDVIFHQGEMVETVVLTITVTGEYFVQTLDSVAAWWEIAEVQPTPVSTETPVPTNASQPTPTSTPLPTSTPTNTPEPTETPELTATPTLGVPSNNPVETEPTAVPAQEHIFMPKVQR